MVAERSGTFRVALLVTLGFGLVIADLYFDRRSTWGLFLIYILSAVTQRWIMSGRTFDSRNATTEESERLAEAKRLFYCGVRLDSETEDEERTAIREILTPRRILLRSLAKYVLIGVYLFLVFKFRLSLRVWDLFFVASAIVLLLSASTGHMLVALALNAVVVLPCALGLPGFGGLFGIVYLFLVAYTFASHLAQEGTPFEEGGESQDEWTRRIVRQCAIAAVALGALSFGIDRILPSTEEEAPKRPVTAKPLPVPKGIKNLAGRMPVREAEKILSALPKDHQTPRPPEIQKLERAVSDAESKGVESLPKLSATEIEKALKALEALPESAETTAARMTLEALGKDGSGSSSSSSGIPSGRGNGSIDLAELKNLIERERRANDEGKAKGFTPEEAKKLLASLPPGTEESPEEMDRRIERALKSTAGYGPGDDDHLVPTPKPMSSEEIAALSKLLERVPERMTVEDAKKVLSGFEGKLSVEDSAKRSLEKSVQRAKREGIDSVEPLKAEDVAAIRKTLVEKSKGGSATEGSPLSEAIRTLDNGDRPRPADRSENDDDPELTGRRKAPEIRIPEATIDFIEKVMKFLLFLGGAIALYLFIRKLRAKHDPESLNSDALRRLSRKERATLWSAMNQIDRAGLSESEEVIARYGLFLELMAKINLPKPIGFPPNEFVASVRGTFPRVDSAISNVTDGFSDVYYGKGTLGNARLLQYRTEHRRIFRALT